MLGQYFNESTSPDTHDKSSRSAQALHPGGSSTLAHIYCIHSESEASDDDFLGLTPVDVSLTGQGARALGSQDSHVSS